MLSLLWLCNVTKYLPIYFTANSVSALKDSICIFECELTCVYQRAQGRAPSTSMPQMASYGSPTISLDGVLVRNRIIDILSMGRPIRKWAGHQPWPTGYELGRSTIQKETSSARFNHPFPPSFSSHLLPLLYLDNSGKMLLCYLRRSVLGC